MPVALEGLQIFIASPGGQDENRDAVVDQLQHFNELRAPQTGLALLPVRWERIPGGAGRPQELINERLRESDFLVLLLHDRWGSPTGEHTSGAEEEFMEALRCLADASRPMKDVLVLFQAVDEARLRDPGPQLQQVLAFRQRLERSHGIYFREFDDLADLARELALAIDKWVGRPDQGPVAVQVALESDEPLDPGRPADVATALAKARESERTGLTTLAEMYFAIAIAEADPTAVADYARFLRRRGRLEKSFETFQQLLSPADSSQAQWGRNANVLANMGLIRRKQGRTEDAKRLLTESVEVARTAGPGAEATLGFALDNLGLVQRRTGQLLEAEQSFLAALEAHLASTSDAPGAAQSLRHLASVSRMRGDTDAAANRLRRASKLLEGTADLRARAAVESELGQLAISAEHLGEAREHLAEALALNEQLGSPDAIGMSLVQLGQLALRDGDHVTALGNAARARDEFTKADNAEGICSADQLEGAGATAARDLDHAVNRLVASIEGFGRAGNVTAQAWSRAYLAEALRLLGRTTEAEEQRQLALEVAERSDSAELRAALAGALAD